MSIRLTQRSVGDSSQQSSLRILVAKTGIAAATLAMLAPPAFADIGWSIDAGAGRTDNATLVDSNPVSDTLSSVGGAIAYTIDSRRIEASLNGHGNYVHYIDDTYDDDFQGFAAGSLALGIVPDTFLWTINDTYGQIAIKQFEPLTPANRQNVNRFTTGPDLILPLGSQSDMKFSARYGDARYEDSDQIDSQTLEGSIAFRRNLSQSTYLGLIASNTRVEYDVPGSQTYDRPAVYGTLDSTGARQSISIAVGVNRVEVDDETFTKPLVRVDWNRRVSPSWTLNLDLGSEYRNTAEQFASQGVDLGPDAANVGVSAIPAATYRGGLGIEFRRPRVQFTLGGGYLQTNYVIDNGLNEDTWYGNTELSRRFTPRLQGFVDYRLEKRKYEANPTQDSDRKVAGARLELLAGKATYLALGYRYTDSSSDASLNTYTDTLYYLTLSYRRGTIASAPAFAH
jgi:hypothetical protein